MTRAALTALLGLAVLAPARGEEKPKAEVLGLLIRKPVPKAGREPDPFSQAGTFLEMGIVAPDREIVALDTDASKATAKDDKGTDLMSKASAGRFRSEVFTMLPRISDDRHRVGFRLWFPGTPAAGSTHAAVAGSVVLLCGTGVKTAAFEGVATGKPGEVKSGPFTLTVGKRTEDGLDLTLTTDKPIFRGVTFVGPDGQKLTAQQIGSGTVRVFEKETHTRDFSLAKPPDTITAKVEYFEKTERVEVPLEAKVGLGLAPAAAPAAVKDAPVLALGVGRKTPEWEKVLSFDFKDGTGVEVLLTQAGKALLDVEGFNNELKTATDDKGTDLLKGGRGSVSRPFGDPPQPGAVRVMLSAPGLPAAGASTVRFTAEVEVVAGSDVKTAEKKGVPLKVGTEEKLAPGITATVEEKFGQKSVKFQVSGTDLASVEFTDSNGKAVESRRVGWSGSPGSSERIVFYSLEKAPDAVGIKLSYYGKIEKVKVPIEVTAGLGF